MGMRQVTRKESGGGGGLPPLLGSNSVDKNEGEIKGQREREEEIR